METTQQVRNLDLKHTAELLNVGPKVLSRKLYELGIFVKKDDGRKVAAPQYVRDGFFVNQLKSFNKEIPGHGYKLEYYEKVLVTEKGINLIREALDADSIEN